MKETKNLKLIREKINHFKSLEKKILKEDLDRDFGRITHKFFDSGFENLEEFKKEISAVAQIYNYVKTGEAKNEVPRHQNKNTAD